VELIMTMKAHKLEPKRMKFVHPYVGEEANMVLIEAVYGGGAQMRIEKPLIVYEAPGKYTPEIYDIYGY
jgi:tRNA1Val (adenine37-N6)-methyltransferase